MTSARRHRKTKRGEYAKDRCEVLKAHQQRNATKLDKKLSRQAKKYAKAIQAFDNASALQITDDVVARSSLDALEPVPKSNLVLN